ncbi:hypothetical protein N8I77_007503 [Diaporthe amygdali]|uniref:C6 transcription factor n=1 Tax=Phomopsis amygdali TaxID=1214568 RepID=A0AAD9SDD4_PHOAM|nr:hypothetical protein N8I77_007503 [Diaporthe amygdali]KAK2604589.1 hypothetical protein N8I77_007503 [Diaporthe amygdali]
MVATRSASRALTPGLDMDAPDLRVSPRKQRAPRPAPPAGWSHAPTTTTLIWLFVSLPLVIWDTGYVLGRPATMPGGWAHAPFWTPYALYGEVDHMYGFKQFNLGNGFTAAQGTLNVIETVMYIAYFTIWYRAAGSLGLRDAKERRRIAGNQAGLAVLLGFSASVMTVSKTVLYWLNEYFSGFDNIGHNKPWDLILLWIIPNGAWLIVPSYMIYQLGSELFDAVNIASRATGSTKYD